MKAVMGISGITVVAGGDRETDKNPVLYVQNYPGTNSLKSNIFLSYRLQHMLRGATH